MKLLYKLIFMFTQTWYVIYKDQLAGNIIVKLEDPTYSPETGMYIDNEEFYSKEELIPSLFLAERARSKKVADDYKELIRGCRWWNVWRANRAFKTGKVFGYADYLFVAKYGKLPTKKDVDMDGVNIQLKVEHSDKELENIRGLK